MPADYPRLASGISDIEALIPDSGEQGGKLNLLSIIKETFTVSSNLLRLQQVVLSYALAQLSGANSVTSYFVPIIALLGDTGGTLKHIFLRGMYGFSKLCFRLFASLFLLDVVGRRRSLFIGIAVQMVSHIYIGVFIKYQKEGSVSNSASALAIAAFFIHAFGYAIGESFPICLVLTILSSPLARPLAYDYNRNQVFHPALCLRNQALAEPDPVFRSRRRPDLPLAVHLRNQVLDT